jgi:hypothetical protein
MTVRNKKVRQRKTLLRLLHKNKAYDYYWTTPYYALARGLRPTVWAWSNVLVFKTKQHKFLI